MATSSRSRSTTLSSLDDDEELSRVSTDMIYPIIWDRYHEQLYVLNQQSLAGFLVNDPEIIPTLPHKDDGYNIYCGNDGTEYFVIEEYLDDDEDESLSYDVVAEPGLLVKETVDQPPPYELTPRLPALAPHVRYFFCTPASRSVAVESGGNSSMLPFIPFADERDFTAYEQKKFVGNFDSFSWEKRDMDPNYLFILRETTRYLRDIRGISTTEIDSLAILPGILQSGDGKPTKLQRDLHNLDSSVAREPFTSQNPPTAQSFSLPLTRRPNALSLKESVGKAIIKTCPNRNCIFPCCMLHGTANPTHPQQPTLTNEYMRRRADQFRSCGANCYAEFDLSDVESELNSYNTSWTSNDISDFETIIEYAPDTLPCDLACLLQKPCINAYIQRVKSLPDARTLSTLRSKENEKLISLPKKYKFKEKKEFDDDDFPDRSKPCFHPFKQCADLAANCPCFENRQRCTAMCRCADVCILRYEGCKCQGPEACKTGGRCKCVTLSRECDPELCTNCSAREVVTELQYLLGNGCRNVEIQRQSYPKLRIEGTKFGLGAFMGQPGLFGEGRCIGEYVGESMAAEGDRMNMLNLFHDLKNLNYSFGLTDNITLDSTYLGNETRFLNHASQESGEVNCYSKAILVNGDLKIVLFSARQIQEGQELFLCYGESYWSGHSKYAPDIDDTMGLDTEQFKEMNVED